MAKSTIRRIKKSRKSSRHDAFAKFSLKHRQTAIGFLRQHLPAELVAHLDLERLVVEGENIIAPKLGISIADAVFSIPRRDSLDSAIIVIVEHLRQPEFLMPFRIIFMVFSYLHGWLRHHHGRRNYRQTIKLPLVVPLVFYNGKKPYHGPLRLLDVFDDAEAFERVLNQPLIVIDTNNLVLDRHENDHSSYVFQTVMKNISSPRINEILLDLRPELKKMSSNAEGMESLHALIKYLLSSAEHLHPDFLLQLAQSLDPGGSSMRSLNARLRKFIPDWDKIVTENRELKRTMKLTVKVAAQAEKVAALEAEKVAALKAEKVAALEAALAAEKKTVETHALSMLREGLDLDLIARVLGTQKDWIYGLQAHMNQPASPGSST